MEQAHSAELRRDVLVGDMRDILADFPENSLDGCVTDPPYHLTEISRGGSPRNPGTGPFGRTKVGTDRGFMGETWDGGDVAFRPETWAHVLRALKPGAFLLVFTAPRTQHRIACAIEDAGFIIADTIANWVFSTGFPKSLDVSKAIDKAAGATRPVVDRNPNFRDPSLHAEHHARWNSASLNEDITAPVTDEAVRWSGWGTALKPAVEPIIVAYKPRDGTVAGNVQKWGTGALNIDGCRVERGAGDRFDYGVDGDEPSVPTKTVYGVYQRVAYEPNPSGRWPANLTFTHHPDCRPTPESPSAACVPGCPVAELDRQSGTTRSAATRHPVEHGDPAEWATGGFGGGLSTPGNQYSDEGGASRFFPTFPWGEDEPPFMYCAKADDHERPTYVDDDGNTVEHVTVKPLALIRWLCRLITPKGGVVLDPFGGSGTTAEAAILEGIGFVICEQSERYIPLIRQRIDRADAGLSPVPEHQKNRDWEERKAADEAAGVGRLFDL